MVARRPDLAVVIAPNGLGHFRRAVAVVAHLITAFQPTPRVQLFAEPWQRERMRGWMPISVLDAVGAVWIGGVVEPGVSWTKNVEDYRSGRLLSWIERLGSHRAATGADLVLSDNLAGTLAVRPDAVLMGSFLWSDVLDDAFGGEGCVDAFVGVERSLLEASLPEMICIAGMASPGVLHRTTAIGVGWMADDVQPADPSSALVAVVGGRTGAANELLTSAARALTDAGVSVMVDPSLRGGVPKAGLFDYQPASWTRVGAVLCRPGMGTLTECVSYRIPVLALSESGNSELVHNSLSLARLGIGIDLGVEPDVRSVAELTSHLIADGGGTIRRRMMQLNTHGIAQAANVLANRLGLHPVDPEREGSMA